MSGSSRRLRHPETEPEEKTEEKTMEVAVRKPEIVEAEVEEQAPSINTELIAKYHIKDLPQGDRVTAF